jgi:anti-sigma regulatory factor (Ser/Thr protein kinase)
MLKLSVLSNPKNLVKIRKKLERETLKAGFNQNDAYNIVLAVDEACTNIIRHSYKNDFTKKINLLIKTANNKFIIEIKNYGIKPTNIKTACRLPLKIRPGGLGVFFIKKIMDKVTYDTNCKRTTKLTLIKKIPVYK